MEKMKKKIVLYCIVLYLLPVLNPKSYDGARVLEASGRPMLVIGRSYGFVSIQEGITKFADEKGEEEITAGTETGNGTPETSRAVTAEAVGTAGTETAGTKLIA